MWIIKRTLLEGDLAGQVAYVDARGYLHESMQFLDPADFYHNEFRAQVATDHYNKHNAWMSDNYPATNDRCKYELVSMEG